MAKTLYLKPGPLDVLLILVLKPFSNLWNPSNDVITVDIAPEPTEPSITIIFCFRQHRHCHILLLIDILVLLLAAIHSSASSSIDVIATSVQQTLVPQVLLSLKVPGVNAISGHTTALVCKGWAGGGRVCMCAGLV
jgi:hypothetical protein